MHYWQPGSHRDVAHLTPSITMAELTVTTAPAAPEIVPPISPFIPLLTAESMSVQTVSVPFLERMTDAEC